MARPKKTVGCVVIVPNVWTSEGKAVLKDKIVIPVDEAKWLESRDQVVVLE